MMVDDEMVRLKKKDEIKNGKKRILKCNYELKMIMESHSCKRCSWRFSPWCARPGRDIAKKS